MEIELDDTEIRVLGSLMEKSLATPEYYPLSLNALTLSCNQKSSRDPVVALGEPTVEAAADRLALKGLVNRSTVGRVPKYEERLSAANQFVPRETAALCVLLLRGPQTAGEIRGRTSRLYAYEGVEAVMRVLRQLEEWGFVHCLARLPGHKEPRYRHRLSSAWESEEPEATGRPAAATPTPTPTDRLANVERELEALRSEVAGLKADFEAFREE